MRWVRRMQLMTQRRNKKRSNEGRIIMKKRALTLTVIANMTSNYSESLGNVASVQKVFKNRKIYTMRSRESLKNALMVQSGMYDDLQTEISSNKKKNVVQKCVSEKVNAANCRALEGGYMNTMSTTYIRNSSFYLTDAISCECFVNEPRFHNNLYLASNFAQKNGLNVQNSEDKVGLMPYQYEYDKGLKCYSMTIDLEMIGRDPNFDMEASAQEKAQRVIMLLNAVENLSLIVKGNMDNAEPIFAIGGLSDRKTHYFENVVHVQEDCLQLSEDLIHKKNQGFYAGLLKGQELLNEQEIEKALQTVSISEFFQQLRNDVKEYFGEEK